MPRLRDAIEGSTFEPDRVKVLGEVFDEVWASLAPEVGEQVDDIEAARMRLAVIVIDLAKDARGRPPDRARLALPHPR